MPPTHPSTEYLFIQQILYFLNHYQVLGTQSARKIISFLTWLIFKIEKDRILKRVIDQVLLVDTVLGSAKRQKFS